MSDRLVTRHNRAIGVLLLVAIAVLYLLTYKVTSVSGSTYDANEAVTYRDFGGTIRNTGSGWFVIDDDAHTPDDITIGTVTSTSVRVNNAACTEVTSVIVGADNEYAQDFGAQFGPSVGLNFFIIEGSVNDGPDAGNAADVWNPTIHYTYGTNIWIIGRCKVGS